MYFLFLFYSILEIVSLNRTINQLLQCIWGCPRKSLAIAFPYFCNATCMAVLVPVAALVCSGCLSLVWLANLPNTAALIGLSYPLCFGSLSCLAVLLQSSLFVPGACRFCKFFSYSR